MTLSSQRTKEAAWRKASVLVANAPSIRCTRGKPWEVTSGWFLRQKAAVRSKAGVEGSTTGSVAINGRDWPPLRRPALPPIYRLHPRRRVFNLARFQEGNPEKRTIEAVTKLFVTCGVQGSCRAKWRQTRVCWFRLLCEKAHQHG